MLYEYRIDGLDTESIVIALELYRWQHSWKVRAIGQGYTGGFAALVTDHGVEVDDAPTLTPALDGVTPNMKPLADSCHDLDDADRTPKRYLTRRDIAEMLGVKHTTITGYDERGLLPEPDIILGRAKGWAEETIREWDAARPGRGVRTDRDPEAVKAREKKLELNRRLAEASAVKTAERKAAAAGADPDVTTAPAASR
jgi:predicted DNA-binding transcriptional regulator AlpA